MSGAGIPSLENGPERPADQGDSRAEPQRARGRRMRRALAWTGSIAAHLMVFGGFFWLHAAPPPVVQPILADLVQEPLPEQPPGPVGPPGPPGPPDLPNMRTPPMTEPKLPQIVIRQASHAPAPPMHEAENAPAPDDYSDVMSAWQLAGATSPGEEGTSGGGGGGGGGGCNMARAVQQALRRDPLVRSSVAAANRQGKSIMLWNGDWVKAGVQEGKGLSAVREAVMWEVAFSPASCRNERVHGLVLLSLSDGNTRFAIGSGEWRWGDLLGVRGGLTER